MAWAAIKAITSTYAATGARSASGSPPTHKNVYMAAPIPSVPSSAPRCANHRRPLLNSAT